MTLRNASAEREVELAHPPDVAPTNDGGSERRSADAGHRVNHRRARDRRTYLIGNCLAIGAAYDEAMKSTTTAGRTQPQPGLLLQVALVANAGFSGLCGALLATESAELDGWLGVDRRVLLALGFALLGYAALLLLGAARRSLMREVGRIALFADVSGVIGATVAIELSHALTSQGSVALVLVTAAVAVLAAAQWLGLRRLGTRVAGVAR